MKLNKLFIHLLGLILLVLSLVLLFNPLAAHAAERFQVLKFQDLSEERFDTVLETLKQGGKSYHVVKENHLSKVDGGVMLIPLANHLSEKNLGRIEEFLKKGGKVVLIPPEEYPDTNTFKLFKDVHITISGSTYAPQTQELRWDKPGGAKDFLPVGSRILMVDTDKNSTAKAMWGETYPAVVTTDEGAFLNWLWGKELMPQTNVQVLSMLTGNATVTVPQTAGLNNGTVLNVPASATFPNAQTGLPGDPAAVANGDGTEPERPNVDYGTFFKKMRDLEDYKRYIYNNIESAIQLSSPVDIRKAEQFLMDAEVHKAKFESSTLAGDTATGDVEYDKTKELLLQGLVLSSASSRVEGRAVWLDRGSIVSSGSPEELRKLIQRLDQAGINIIYFETVNAGYPIYPSKLLPHNPLVQNWDPLKVAVEEGHRLGIEVHAWVWCFAVGNKKHNAVINRSDGYAGPILTEKGLMSEALRSAGGGLVPSRQTEYWLSPASPKGRKFLKDVYSEIVSNYDVDGLQLDYIRYPFQHSGAYMGYEGIGRERFEAETGMLLSSPDEYTLKAWTAWKSYQVSSFVKEVSQTLKSIKPDLKLSAAVFPMRRADRIMAIQQDWETWVDKGWIDTLSPMSYTTSPDELQSTIEKLSSSSEKQIILYPGIAILKMDTLDLLNMLDAARRKGSMGSTIFAMAHLDDTKLQALGKGPYKDKPLPPHRDPLRAMSLILNDYESLFNVLASKGELYVLGPENIQSIRKSMNVLKTRVGNLEQSLGTTGTYSEASLEELRTAFLSFQQENQFWLDQEKSAHAFRAYHFGADMARMNNLLNYALDKISAGGLPTTAKIQQDNQISK